MSGGPMTVDTESTLEGEGERGPPRAGRRMMNNMMSDPEPPVPQREHVDEDTDRPSPPPASKSGWGVSDEGSGEPPQAFSGVSRRKAQQQQQDTSSGIDGGPSRRKHDEPDEIDGILEIPELDADNDEDITRQVAAPPKLRSNRVQTIKELDHDIQFTLPTNNDKEIDLSLLTACLCSAEQVAEPQGLWEMDSLLAEVASEINQEDESLEKDKDGAEGEGSEPSDNPLNGF
ncbi:hypothetical protein CYMTET_27497 [Cymbomonas tetramitiformis]|uniref:Intraflagellar transport protein 43 homolog n=1 Tax=Cymbomonas tetramitiformis TaxID=36881 RepID=A0AAE0FQB1_9CHLO|nr:hypothetical protein CYMTET_46168 [Cymbomonas tetramitiformis]KAK3263715.1 hypothetical protein CYMTET_27497 [Cymbomonas tetramitiformis]|eukprot:gene9062-10739_t